MPSATLAVGDLGEATWSSTPALVDNVQGWLDDPVTNHGWLVMGNESSGGTSKRFASRDAADETKRPVLTIEYSMPSRVPATGPLGLAILGVLLALGGITRHAKSPRLQEHPVGIAQPRSVDHRRGLAAGHPVARQGRPTDLEEEKGRPGPRRRVALAEELCEQGVGCASACSESVPAVRW